MRTLLLFAAFLVSSVNSIAGDMKIRIWDDSYFVFQLDNNFYNRPERVYDLMNVSKGYHFLQVYTISEDGEPGLLFKGYIFVPEMSYVMATVESDHRVKVTTTTVNRPAGTENPPAEQRKAVEPLLSGKGPVSDEEIKELKKSLDKVKVSTDKLAAAKSSVQGRTLTSQQVADLIKGFVFESDKIELAKYCYDLTTDKSKYYLVNKSFSFPSSKEEMDEFVKSHK